MAGEREFAAAPERESVDGRNHRLGATLDRPKDLLPDARGVGKRGRILSRDGCDVRARDEGATRARQDDGADAGVRVERGDAHPNLTHERGVECVELVGAIDRDRGNAVHNLDEQHLV